MISSGFTLFLIGGLGGLKSKHESVCFTRMQEDCGGVSGSEELVGAITGDEEVGLFL